ncbi:GGDEF domain-containing protein [Paenibacillus sp. MMS18-CY102]|uniref:GGDEF domain-containing protein n=1 Tax=Paenibacillus sp. MMS18-CY102 TaxID=2682849 RepID=UPI0013665B6B|nr:GGDEF domain-containing protein [Paenibacillus sp. MMS18-CY102]MWC30800.1 diguanylate cyclase [Paenibacillus sp. MMS18-CY102]
MNLHIDTKTVLVLIGLGHLFTSILIGAYWYGQPKNKLLHLFLLGKCAESVAWLGSALRPEHPSMLYLLIINAMLYIAATCEIMALLSLREELRPRTRRIYYALTALSIVGFALLELFYNKESVRVAYSSIVSTVLLFPVYRMLIQRSATALTRVTGFLYVLVFAMGCLKGASALLTGSRIQVFSPGIYETLMVLSLFLLMIVENSGFVLLLKEKSDQELVRLASYDDLTKTLNRRTFALEANRCLAEHAKRRAPISFVLFDIDHFKVINDTFGHMAGDDVLQDMTSQIQSELDGEALFVRYGGDEFGIMLLGKDEIASDSVVEKIKASLGDAASRGLPASYTISIGVLTIVPDRQTQLNALYSSCDKALYIAKNKGRNYVHRARLDQYLDVRKELSG